MTENDKPEHKKPEFIYIEDYRFEEEQEQSRGRGSAEYFESIEKLGRAKYPWFLRLITLIVTLFLAAWSAVMLFVYVLFTVLNAATLFRFDNLQNSARFYWKTLSKTLVFALGGFVAIFNPPFGFGIIILYFMMLGEKLNKDLMEKMMQGNL